MAAALTILTKYASGRSTEIRGTIALTGNYTALGDPLPVSAFDAKTTKLPHIVIVKGKLGNNYEYDAEAGKLKVLTAPGVELAAGAYPASVLTDVIRFEANFPKFG